MMNKNIYLERVRAVKSRLKTSDSALITNLVNIRYLTGFSGSAGIFAMTPDGDHLIVDFRYTEQAKEETPFEITQRNGSLEKNVEEWLRGGKVCSIEAHCITLDLWERLRLFSEIRWVPEKDLVESVRIIKSKDEILKLKSACELLSELMKKTIKKIKAGSSELDVAIHFETLARKATGKPLPFEPIVASGPRSALPHGISSKRIINSKELVVVDIGLNLDGYIADMTRTVCCGKSESWMRDIHESVLLANLTASKCIRPGMTGKEAHSIALGVLDAKNLSDYFGHGLGHGLGVEVHEGPSLSIESNNRLENGMVFTIEPGVYIPNKGGVRIEDSGVLIENKFNNFPAPDRSLIEL
ncbi:MAG: Xaa-Pro dipeptidase [Candidatus Hydrogenedentes bacterium CG07_land_8_20_14_0_80_42_17]|nr:MAG: Xaa-Pro dipeptidase [Candidatus Hydrogenedentes bacterium CG07_land_8_20_14_0_80_42_17]